MSASPPRSLFQSVRGRLVLLVLSLLAPALLLVAVLIYRAYHNERASVAGQLLSTARAVAAVVDREMLEADAILRTLAASQALADANFDAVDGIARRALLNDRRWFVLGDARYEQIVNTLVPFGTRVPPIPDDAELRAAMDRGQTYISNLMQGPVAQALVMHVSRPFLVDGQLKYTLHLTTRPAQLAETLAIERYAPGSLITILDRNDRIVLRTRESAKYAGTLASAKMRAHFAAASEGVHDTVTLDGVPSLTAYHRSPLSGWVALIAAPKTQLFASARELLWTGLGLSALLLLVAGMIAAWIGRGLAHGVDSLVAGSEAITRGEPVEFQPSGLRETDFIAAAIARSAQHQRQISEKLETALAQEKTARADAQRAAERLHFSLSSLHLGEWDWDVASDTIRVSPRAAAIYGLDPRGTYTREQMRQALHPDDIDRARTAAREAVESGADYLIEYRVQHPSYGQRWVAASGRPVFDSRGKVTSMMGVVQDITERRQAELVLRTQNELLEQRVTERTRRLRETIGELEAFSYSISHDMRAPLRSMHSYAKLLQAEHAAQFDDNARHYLERIRSNAARLELLVRDVLAYSRVAKEQIELRPVELDAFVSDLVQQMPEVQTPGVTIDIQRPLPRALAHDAYLSQVLTNLIGNAVKFVAPGVPPRVEISATPHQGAIRLAVRDNGIGIDPADADRIFQIFGRVNSSAGYEGTGIGLAIVKKAVQRMGGEIGVESRLGHGATFWFTLPRA